MQRFGLQMMRTIRCGASHFCLAGDNCTCAGKHNKYKEGGRCATYRGYSDTWNNGVWCFADMNTCADAKAHPHKTVPGFGASRAACIGPRVLVRVRTLQLPT